MEEPKFVINTSMTKEDYKRFLYIATFRKNKYTIPILGLISFVGSVIIAFNSGNFSFIGFIVGWPLLFGLTIMVIMFKIERKNTQRIKTDKTGTFDSIYILEFYDDKILMENDFLKSKGQIMYNQFYFLMESKEYFIFYLTGNQASLIRKKDINNLAEFKEFILGKFKGKYKVI